MTRDLIIWTLKNGNPGQLLDVRAEAADLLQSDARAGLGSESDRETRSRCIWAIRHAPNISQISAVRSEAAEMLRLEPVTETESATESLPASESDYTCGDCEAAPGAPCTTRSGRAKTGYHKSRKDQLAAA